MLELLSRVFIPGPLPGVIVFIVYIVLIKCIAPKCFGRKSPHKLTFIRILYYIIQILLNLWIMLMLWLTGGLFVYYSWCNQMLVMTAENVHWVDGALWYFYYAKWFDLMSTLLLGLERRFNEIYSTQLIYEGIVLQTAWNVFGRTKSSHISFFVFVEAITQVGIHFTNIVTVKHPKINRNAILTYRFLQGSFLVLHSVEALTFNFCEIPADYMILIPVNAIAMFAMIISNVRGFNKHKVAKKFDGVSAGSSSIIDFDYGYNPPSPTSSFFNFGGDPNDIKKRSVNKLQAQV